MADENIVEFVESWQTGFFLLVGIGVTGVVAGAIAGSATSEGGMYLGALGGMVLGFVAIAYLLYGR